MQLSPRVRSVVTVAGLAGVVLLLGGCSALYPPNAASSQGADIRTLYSIFMVPMIAIFVLVEGLIVWSVLRYRRRKGDDELPVQTHGNNLLEITWTVLPTLLVLGLFFVSWQTLNKVDAEPANPAVTVDVTGFQWQWTFAYPQYNLSYTGIGDQGPVLVLPVDEVIHVRLHSNDVIHSFYVPDFLFKRDVIPGQVNNFDLNLKDAGVTYTGQCAQLCGMGHYQMRFTVQTMTPANFQAWVQTEQAKAQATPAPAAGGQAGPTLQLSASSTTSFDESSLSAPAGQPFTVQLTNKTAGAPHNFSIKDASGKVLFTGLPLAQPGQTVSYSVPALPAGTYTFFCSVHPNMTGTLTVK